MKKYNQTKKGWLKLPLSGRASSCWWSQLHILSFQKQQCRTNWSLELVGPLKKVQLCLFFCLLAKITFALLIGVFFFFLQTFFLKRMRLKWTNKQGNKLWKCNDNLADWGKTKVFLCCLSYLCFFVFRGKNVRKEMLSWLLAMPSQACPHHGFSYMVII